jgi:hypothetical protein
MIFSLSDNSKTFILTYPEYDLKFEWVLTTVPWYWKHYRFDYECEWIKIKDGFSITLWRQKGAVTSFSKITFTGSFITYFGVNFLYNFIEYNFDSNFLLEVRRFDISCDVPEKKQNVVNSITWIITSKINYNKKLKEYETLYIWRRQKNTSFIRIYDKILDTIKKSKTHLYNFENEFLTRVEIEFNDEYIKWFNKSNYWKIYRKTLLTDEKFIKDLYLSRISEDMTFFSDLSFHKYEFNFIKPTRIDLAKYYLDTKQLPPRWQKNALWMFIKLKNIIWIENLINYLKLTPDESLSFFKYYTEKKKYLMNCKIKRKNNSINKLTKYWKIMSGNLEKAEEVNELLLQKNVWKWEIISHLIDTAIIDYYLITTK